MPVDLSKPYETRRGYPVTRMTINPRDDSGHPVLAAFRLPDGTEDEHWYTLEGKWSARPDWVSELDLVEVVDYEPDVDLALAEASA